MSEIFKEAIVVDKVTTRLVCKYVMWKWTRDQLLFWEAISNSSGARQMIQSRWWKRVPAWNTMSARLCPFPFIDALARHWFALAVKGYIAARLLPPAGGGETPAALIPNHTVQETDTRFPFDATHSRASFKYEQTTSTEFKPNIILDCLPSFPFEFSLIIHWRRKIIHHLHQRRLSAFLLITRNSTFSSSQSRSLSSLLH